MNPTAIPQTLLQTALTTYWAHHTNSTVIHLTQRNKAKDKITPSLVYAAVGLMNAHVLKASSRVATA